MERMFVVFRSKYRGAQNSKHALHTINKSAWIRTAGQKYSDELRLTFHISQSSVGSPLTGVSSQLNRGLYFSICKATRVVVKYLAITSNVTDGGTPSWATSSVWKTLRLSGKLSIHSKNRNQNIRRVCFWYKGANIGPATVTARARAILTNHGLRRCPWHVYARLGRGGRGHQDQARRRLVHNPHFREQMLPITRPRGIWEIVWEVTILAGAPMSPAIAQYRPISDPSQLNPNLQQQSRK